MKYSEEQLSEFLLDTGLITKNVFETARTIAKQESRNIGDVLVSDGKISEDEFRQVEAHLLGIPYVSLKGLTIQKEVLALIPEPIARRHNIVAYKKSEGKLEVAMLDPQDFEAIEFVRRTVNFKIFPRLTDTDSIKQVLSQYRKSLSVEFSELIKQEAGKVSVLHANVKGKDINVGDLAKLAEDIPIVKIVNSVLEHAITQRASDIHIEPFEQEVLVRFRIDGILHDVMTLPKNIAPGISARIKVLSGLRLDEKRLPQDGRFKIETHGEHVSFRVSTLPTYSGEKIVMRLLPDKTKGLTLESLGFHGASAEQVHGAIRQTTGMVLTTGPTGSGKTTTLYTLIDILNSPEVNISTIEDPIEYQMPRINQTQAKPDIGLTFSSGLRTLVRQDPDIIMVGEIRDGETANLAINAALTGHLVLSTLHTNSAAGAIPRLIDMGTEPFLIVSTVKVVIAQRLVRKLCMVREKYTLTQAEISNIEKHIDTERVLAALRNEKIITGKGNLSSVPFFKAKKSEECQDGFSGRIGIYEVLPITGAIKELIMKEATIDNIEKEARRAGMMTMFEDGLFKAAQGLTTLEEVLRVVNE